MHEGWGGGGTLPLSYSQGWDKRNCFQYPLEGHSETSNDQALLNPFDHYIKKKAYMRVEVGWEETLYPGVDFPPPLPLIEYVHRDEIGELFPASSWRAFRNFKWPGSSQSLWSLHKNESIQEGMDTLPQGVDCPPPPIDYVQKDEIPEIVSSILLKGIQKL